MTLVVEDGSNVTGAESYASVASADARAVALGNDAWTGLDDETKEQRLRKSTIYMTQAYRQRWKGSRQYRIQALDWPRFNVMIDGWWIDVNTVPADVANACIDLAFNSDIDNLAPDQTRAVVRKKIGPLETEWDRNSPQTTRRSALDMALAPFLQGASMQAALVR